MPTLTHVLTRGLCVVALIAGPFAAAAQVRDSTARRPPTVPTKTTPDSLIPPISPPRAFLLSFLAPGYSQSVLGRHKAAAAFMMVEAISVVMIRESAADVHEARRMANDTVVVSYVDASGNAVAPVVAAPRFGDKEIHTREAHVEDWAALLIANHLFAGADAFVAAHLWDIPVRLALRAVPHGATITAAFKW